MQLESGHKGWAGAQSNGGGGGGAVGNADVCPFICHTFWQRKTGITYVFLSEAAYIARSDLLEIIMSLMTFTKFFYLKPLYSGIIDIQSNVYI